MTTSEFNLQPAAVRFNDNEAIEVEKIFDFADSYSGKYGYASPTEVIWEDGSWSYAKGWWDLQTGRLLDVTCAGQFLVRRAA